MTPANRRAGPGEDEAHIAKIDHTSGADVSALQVRADVLRDLQAAADANAEWEFVLMPEDAAPAPGGSRKDWCESDVKRALAAAQEAGLTDYRVEIAPDGTITIFVGAGAAKPDPA